MSETFLHLFLYDLTNYILTCDNALFNPYLVFQEFTFNFRLASRQAFAQYAQALSQAVLAR